MIYPENPSDGMLFESTPGVYYEYQMSLKSWVRVNSPNIPVATQYSDGLMSKEDYSKVIGMLDDPPVTVLSVEGCDEQYSSGLLTFNSDESDIIKIDMPEENLHENTAIINFKLDLEKFAQNMIDEGKLKFIALSGDDGNKGDKGADGLNSLDTGPQGDDGPNGLNMPWPGTLTEETFDVSHDNKAIVDIRQEKVSSEENYLVVRRANIGNPNACPDSIIPQDVQSPWIIGFGNDADANAVSVVNNNSICSVYCRSSIFYFDIDVIIQSIKTHFINYLQIVKQEKEELAESWIAAMITQYNEQKSALCCALEACKSRTRNVRQREYIEQQRIQAAQAGYRLVIGNDEDKVYPPADAELGPCAWAIVPTNYNLLKLSDPACEIDYSAICGNYGVFHSDSLPDEMKDYLCDLDNVIIFT